MDKWVKVVGVPAQGGSYAGGDQPGEAPIMELDLSTDTLTFKASVRDAVLSALGVVSHDDATEITAGVVFYNTVTGKLEVGTDEGN